MSNNKPTYYASTPVKGKDDKTFWHRIGSARQTDKGINIKLNSLPVNGEISLFTADEKPEQDAA